MSSRGQPSRLSTVTDHSDKQHSFGQSSPALQSTSSPSSHDKEQTLSTGNGETVSRRMRLLALRKPRSESALSKKRQKNLEEMREKEKEADLMAARLDSRLEIVNMFINKSLVDDSFLGRKELNPWLFKNNNNLRHKWNFVHNMVTTQEMLVAIDSAKKRHKDDMEEEKERRLADARQKTDEKEHSNVSQVVKVEIEQVPKHLQTPVEEKEPEEEETEQVEDENPHEQEYVEQIDLPPNPQGARDNEITPDLKEEPPNDSVEVEPEVFGSAAMHMSPVLIPKRRLRPSAPARGKTRHVLPKPVKCHGGTVKVYAFGSTHRRTCCKYCRGEPKIFIEHPKSAKTSSKSPSNEMNERLDDINGIYVKDPERKSFNEKMQERIQQVEEIMKERVVNFHEQMIKNGYVN